MGLPDIPFEPQRRLRANRLCGAAAVSMVFRALGIPCRQEDVWGEIARPDRRGTRAARTCSLASAALERGLAALILQARRPWHVLQKAVEQGVPVILNHRLESNSPLGHYTVLLAADRRHAVIHDPSFGPRRRLTRRELLELWRPSQGGCEIVGHVLVAISRANLPSATCGICGTLIPAEIACPACARPVPLQPGSLLGCLRDHCPGRAWVRLFCPACDCAVLDSRPQARSKKYRTADRARNPGGK